jgi:hypothetical protein
MLCSCCQVLISCSSQMAEKFVSGENVLDKLLHAILH